MPNDGWSWHLVLDTRSKNRRSLLTNTIHPLTVISDTDFSDTKYSLDTSMFCGQFLFLDNIVLTADGVRLVTSLSIVICMYGLMLVSGLDIMLIILDSTRQYYHYIGDY